MRFYEPETPRPVIVVRHVASGRSLLPLSPETRIGRQPCSTFKVLLALAALETGIVRSPEALWKWDGTASRFPDWNRDHSLRTALETSAQWPFQRIARSLGPARLARIVANTRYGNGTIGADPTRCWHDGSLKISPEEQAEFALRLATDRLPFSPRVHAAVRAILPAAPGLRGKTGTGENLGWFVGLAGTGTAALAFAVLLEGDGVMGRDARRVAVDSLPRWQAQIPRRSGQDFG